MEVNLLSVLEDGKAQLEQLVQLAEQKQKAIVENKREAISQLSQKELELTGSLQNWEKERLLCCGQLTLKQLALEEDSQTQLQLLNLREELVFLTQKLASLNQQNTELLKHALAYTEYCLSLFQTDSQTYGQRGEGNLTFLDRKI